MNIYISKEQFDYLMIDSNKKLFYIGSFLYQTNNKNSDLDVLVILSNKVIDFPCHHQLHYKDIDVYLI